MAGSYVSRLTPVQAREKGREALRHYHNSALLYSNYTLTFDELVQAAGLKFPDLFLQNLGDSIDIQDQLIGFSSGDLASAMGRLADKGEGKLPATQNLWFQALSDEVMNFNFVDALPFVAVESLKDAAVGAQKIGDTILDTAKILASIAPFVVIGSLLYIAFQKTKRYAGTK